MSLREYPPTGIGAGGTWTKDLSDVVAPRAGTTNYAKHKTKLTGGAYGNGWYVASANTIYEYTAATSTYGSDEWPPSGAFDKLDGASFTKQGWHTAESLPNTTDASPAPFVAIAMPNFIILSSYNMKLRMDGNIPSQGPMKWNLYGSTDGGTNWTFIHLINVSPAWSTLEEVKTFSVSTSTAYNAFKFEVLRANSSVAGWMHIGEIRLYGTPEFRMSRIINDSYPSAITSANSMAMVPGSLTRLSAMRGINGMPLGSIRLSDMMNRFVPSDSLYPSSFFRILTYEGTNRFIRVNPSNANANASSQHIYFTSQLDTSATYNGIIKGGFVHWLKDQGTGLFLNHNNFVMFMSASPNSVNFGFRAVPDNMVPGTYKLRSVFNGNYYIGYDSSADRMRIYAEGDASIRSFVFDTSDVPPVTSGLVGCFPSESYNGTQWSDVSGTGNNITNITGTITPARTIMLNEDYLSGGTTASLTLPTSLVSSTYTVFNVSKMSGNIYSDSLSPGVNTSEWVITTSQKTRYKNQKVMRGTTVLPVTSGLVGLYTGESWTGTQWTDLSGSSNHVTTIGGTITINSATLGGRVFLSGSQSSTLLWPAAILPATYTMFHIAKYNGANKGRIFTGYSSNWLSGFWSGRSGVAYHNGNLADILVDIHGSNWVLSTDQNNLYRSNLVNRVTGASGTPTYDRIGVGVTSGGYAEPSDWAIACVIVYNTTLTSGEINQVENWLMKQYAFMAQVNWGVANVIAYNRELTLYEILQMENWLVNKYALLSVPPITYGMVGYYPAESWTGTQWTDLSGNGNHVTTVSGTISINYSSIGGRDFLNGGTTSTMRWPAIVPASYTLFHIAKYNGSSRGRIFTGSVQNWLSGFHNGNTGCAFHNGWITSYTTLHGTNWVLSTDQNSMYRSNLINRTNGTPGSPSYDSTICVNTGNIGSEQSDWAIACVIIFNRTLTASEITAMENWLQIRYNLMSSMAPVTSGLVGFYVGENWNGSTWMDTSASANNVTTVAGTVSTSTLAGRTILTGTTATSLLWPTAILPSTYTLFHLAKYNGATKSRIFQGYTVNWLSGFHSVKSGVAYHNGTTFVSGTVDLHGSDWVLSTDQNNMYKSNRIDRTIGKGGSPSFDRLAVNISTVSGASGETSDWAIACVLVYNRTLSSVEIASVENWIAQTYYIAAMITVPPSVYTREDPNTYGLTLWLDGMNHLSGSTIWADQTLNNYNFNITSGTYRVDSMVPHMNTEGAYGAPRRVVGGALSDIPPFPNATLVVFTSIKNSTGDWRTLLRGATNDHQVIIESGSNRIGMYDNKGTNFNYSGLDVTSLPTPYTNFNMLVFRFAQNIPYYQLSLGMDTRRYNVTGTGASFVNGYCVVGACQSGIDLTNPANASQYWGKIGTFLYYNRNLTRADLFDIYNQYKTRYNFIHPGDPCFFESGQWNVLYELTNPQRDTSGNLIFTQDNAAALANKSHSRIAYYMQNRMGNGVMYYIYVSMDAYSTTLTDYKIPDNNNAFANQRNVTNLVVYSNHPQVGNYTAPNGRLEIWPYNYSTATMYGDGSGTTHDYDDTYNIVTDGHGSVQVHDITNKKTLLAWNLHRNGASNTPAIGIGNNDATNIHYTTTGGPHPDWTSAANGAYEWKFQVLIDTDDEFIDNISSSAATSLVGAYSLQRLSKNYFGPTVRVRRSTDNVTADFYADVAGNLGLRVDATGQSLVNWLADAVGFVSIWYDQSGKGNHATQTTATAQPSININNKFLYFTASQYFNLPDGTVPYGNSQYTIIAEHDVVSATFGTIVSSGNYGVNFTMNTVRINSSGGYLNYWWGNDVSISSGYVPGNTITWKYDQVNRYGYINGALQVTTPSSNRISTQFNNTIGAANGGNADPLTGGLYYLYIFNTAISDSDRLIAEASMWVQPVFIGVLDSMSGSGRTSLNAGYSIRRLSNTYFGPIINVRRGSDNVTRDFYSDNLGNLGVLLHGRGQSLTSWLNGATGYVTIWYDQSGNRRNATQTSTASQPTINATTKVVSFATSQYMSLPDGTVPFGNTVYTITAKHGTIGNTTEGTIIASGTYNSNNSTNSIIRRSTTTYSNYWWASDVATPSGYADGNTITFRYDQANRYGYINSVLQVTQASTNRASTSTTNTIGAANNGASGYLQGDLYHVLVFNTSLIDNDRVIAERFITNQPMRMYLFGVTGSTWLDISGNDYNATFAGSLVTTTRFGGGYTTPANQITNYLIMPAAALQSLTNGYSWTINTWLELVTISGTRYWMHMSVAGGNDFIFQVDSAGVLTVYGGALVSGTNPTFTANTPTMITLVRNSSTWSLYKNGTFAASYTYTGVDTKTIVYWIMDQESDAPGGGFDPNQNTNANWFEVALFDRILSAADITSEYNRTKGRYGL